MKKTVQLAALVSAMVMSAAVMAQGQPDTVTKPAPSTESKAPMGDQSKSRDQVKQESHTGANPVLKKSPSTESKAPAGASYNTRDEVKQDRANKKGTNKDGMNEPESAYPNKTK